MDQGDVIIRPSSKVCPSVSDQLLTLSSLWYHSKHYLCVFNHLKVRGVNWLYSTIQV